MILLVVHLASQYTSIGNGVNGATECIRTRGNLTATMSACEADGIDPSPSSHALYFQQAAWISNCYAGPLGLPGHQCFLHHLLEYVLLGLVGSPLPQTGTVLPHPPPRHPHHCHRGLRLPVALLTREASGTQTGAYWGGEHCVRVVRQRRYVACGMGQWHSHALPPLCSDPSTWGAAPTIRNSSVWQPESLVLKRESVRSSWQIQGWYGLSLYVLWPLETRQNLKNNERFFINKIMFYTCQLVLLYALFFTVNKQIMKT